MSADSINNVLIVGAGVMGKQIAAQCVMAGLNSTLHDTNPQAFDVDTSTSDTFCNFLWADGVTPAKLDALLAKVHTEIDPRKAAENCDLLIEAVSERRRTKEAVFGQFNELCPDRTIFVTNSSTLVPSVLAPATGRAERFAGLHFSLGISLAELMAHEQTDHAVLDTIEAFAHRIADVVVVCQKECRGYLLNPLLMALNGTAVTLAADGVASFEDIDRVFMKSTGARRGPFGSLDGIGLDTALDITRMVAQITGDPEGKQRVAYLQSFVDRGRLGRKSGSGFYDYPNPAWKQPEFLNGHPRTGHAEPVSAVPASPSPSATDDRLTRRFALRLKEAPLRSPSAEQSMLTGAAVVVGMNSDAVALVRRLQEQGLTMHSLPLQGGIDQAIGTLEYFWDQEPIHNLFIMTGRSPAAVQDLHDLDAWHQRKTAGLMLPLLIVQHWLGMVDRAKLLESSRLAAVVSLGGDFGLSGDIPAVESGGITGLLKALRVEQPYLKQIKVLDSPQHEPSDDLATALLDELSSDDADVEVSIRDGVRSVIRLSDAPSQVAATPQIERGSVWVVTGGARGVTAIATREFAIRHQLRVHLVGRTSIPPLDPQWPQWSDGQLEEHLRATLQQRGVSAEDAASKATQQREIIRSLHVLHAQGVQAVYHSCDVANRDELGTVLATVRAQSGPITGVVHGAGVDAGTPFLKLQPETVEWVLSAKLDGARNLIELTADDPLRYLIGFGSTSGRFGAFCNADYSLANDMLAKMISRAAALRPGLIGQTIHWTAWDEAGMCMRPRSRFALEVMRVKLMPSAEGAAQMIDAIEQHSAECEIVVCDHPDGVHSPHVTMSDVV